MIASLLWDPLHSCGAPRVLLMALLTAVLALTGWFAARRFSRLHRALLALALSSAFLLPWLEALVQGAWQVRLFHQVGAQDDWMALLRENRLAPVGDEVLRVPLLHTYGAAGETPAVGLLNRQLRAGSVDRDNLLSLMGAGGYSGEGGKLARWKSPVRAAFVSVARTRDTKGDFLRLALQPFHSRPLVLEGAHPEADSGAISGAWTMLALQPGRGGQSKAALPEHHQGGWVYLSDSHYPGWSAKVDGVWKPLHLAERAFRAVKVRAGDKEVEFLYRPASFGVGLGMSLLALIFVLLRSPKTAKGLR